MGDKVTLTRPNGTTLDATPEQAQRLAVLGYRPVTEDENQARLATEARTDYYTSGTQQAKAGLEGLASGATLGGSDYLFGDDDSKARAAFNPGTRLGAETVGAILPMLLTDGASAGLGAESEASLASRLVRAAPSNVLSDLASGLAVGREGSLTRAVTKGAVEGGLFGGFQEADHTYMAGDPVTAEAVLHGVGWGTVFGGGLGFLGGGAEAVGAKASESLAAEKAAAAEAHGALQEGQMAADSAAATQNVKNSQAYFDDLVAKAKDVRQPVAEGTLKAVSGDSYDSVQRVVTGFGRSVEKAQVVADSVVNQTLDDFVTRAGDSISAISDELGAAKKAYASARAAAASGKVATLETQIAEYKKAVETIGSIFDIPPGSLPNPGEALKQLSQMKLVARELSSIPKTVNEFALMGPAKFERLSAALEASKKLPFNGEGLLSTVGDLAKSLGIDSTSPDVLRSVWKASKMMFAAEGKAVPKFEPGELPKAVEPKTIAKAPGPRPADVPLAPDKHEGPAFLDHALGYVLGGKAYAAARVAGFGHGASYATYRGVKEAISNASLLSNVRTAAVGRLRQAAAEYLPGAGAAARLSIPTATAVATSLSTNLSGQQQAIRAGQSSQDLAKQRVEEIARAAPTVKDTLFRSLEPLSATQPVLTPALHAAALTAFQALMGMLPKDTGAISAMQSIWKPSQIQAVVLSKQLSVFHDPNGAAADMLAANNLDPIKIKALREIAPNTWQDLRLAMLERITQPEVAAKLTYRDQVGLSTMLDIDIHSSTQPQQIASSQAIFAQRAKPLMSNPRMGQNGGLPNPQDAANNPGATQSQRDTER